MQRKVKMVFSEQFMRALFCVLLRVGKTLVVPMGSQAAYAARALRQPRPPLRGHIFSNKLVKVPSYAIKRVFVVAVEPALTNARLIA